MKILKAKFILLCDKDFTILENCAIAFDEEIKEVGEFDKLSAKFQEAEILDYGSDIAMPCFINPHVHLEFSSNKTTLVYGDFIKWVNSIVKSRDNLSKEANESLIKNKIYEMMRSGISTIGEISSFGGEMEVCANSPLRVVFFNEILGASKDVVTQNWEKFKDRFKRSDELKSDKFIPAVSIHSPYSTHPNLTKKACEFARLNSLTVSTHFLESDYENRWIRDGKGEFKNWLKAFNPNPKPMYNVESFISNFKGIKTLFTHCVYLKEFELLDRNLHSITTCAFSNRLLSKKKLNLKKAIKSGVNLSLGTDGLSSNISLNFFDELRTNLLVHSDLNLQNLAKTLLLAATNGDALGLNLGEIKNGKIADIAVFEGFEVESKDEVALQLILQTNKVKEMFIKGKRWNF
ncbi:metal-dependent hydrolase [Campylobacter corcagiensis]|uniref:Metal-dependent hydrolase n=1 Tax=Campylobacter corcagiensis TaxID=1448857 RepID=A0A7M1LHI0_9BACT|nr:metal-dependent hydrolase [Campylobacter corcagiensis]QKF64308.1 metallo-dependent hydrolase, subgroup D [Campylobacter corcagiensis]QOQ87504.1 metal-dependent hydrolase [Campylobacter corcagiensis]